MKEAARQAIAAKINSIALAIPTCWHGHVEPPNAAAWGRWSIVWGDTKAAAVGSGMSRTWGIATLQIMLAEGQGMKPAHTAADTISDSLRQWQTQITSGGRPGTVTFAEISGPTDNGASAAFWQYSIRAPFYVDFYP